MTDFLDTFSSYRNDILYGTQASRETYVYAYIAEAYQQEDADFKVAHPLQDDETFPETYDDKVHDRLEKSGVYINSYNEPITSADFRDLDRIRMGQAGNVRITAYLASLQRTKYAVDKIGAATLRSLIKGDDTLKDATGMDAIPKEDHAALIQLAAVRRACKFGIEYISQRSDSVVHYILDEIIAKDVVDQTTYSNFLGKKGVPITTSELRFLFRNWYHLKYRAMNKRLYFYKDQKFVRAPWYGDPALWLPYALYRVEKFEAANPRPPVRQDNLVASFRHNMAIKRPTQALQSSFALKTSETLM